VIEPGNAIAQMFFVARKLQRDAEIRFSRDNPGADPGYAAAWDELGAALVRAGRGKIVERTGVASIQLGCPHCFASVTAAIARGIPDDHQLSRGFNPAYKILKAEHEMLAKGLEGGPEKERG
jgi:hypothetical protein